jgi:Na+/proline symporter
MGWIALYVLVQLTIGVAVARRIRTEDDYLLAGRRLGPLLITFSIFATWFGAETCVDSAGQVYAEGLGWGSTEPYAYALAIAVMGLVFALPLWRARIYTLADLFRVRFSPRVEALAALLLIPTSIFWAAAQVRAFGGVIAHASDLPFAASTGVAAGVVVIYTVSGGMLADAVTDLVQGIALVLGLIVLLCAAVAASGGPEAALAAAQAHEPITPAAAPSLLDLLETWTAPILGALVAQELISRISAARSGRVARGSTLAAALAYGLVGSIPVALGLLAPTLLQQGAAHPELVLPQLAQERLHQAGYVLFAGALVSAILSTVDSALLVCSALLSHNLVARLAPAASERAKVRVARAGVVLFGLVAFALALGFDSVGELIDLTNEFGSAGVFVLLVFGMFTRFGGPASALAALVLGAATYVGGSLADWEHPYLASLAAALAGYVGIALGARTLGRALTAAS